MRMLHAEGLLIKRLDGKLPDSWVRSQSLRKLLRSSKVSRNEASAREAYIAPSKKKQSSASAKFDHRRLQSEHQESGSVTFYETRGVRDSRNTLLFSDIEVTLSLGNYTGSSEADTYTFLFKIANEWLKETGEMDFFAVAGDADKAKDKAHTRKQKRRIDRFVFQRWWFELGIKHGFLSPKATGARFLAAADHVHRLAKGNQELERAIYQFADAWHWMRFESSDEHELAAVGMKSKQGRAQGPIAKQERAELKKHLLKESFESFASDDRNGSTRKSPKGAAGAMFLDVNRKLKVLGLSPFAEKTLADELRPLIKERFEKPKKKKKP